MKYIQNITLDVNCNPANYQYINAKQCDNASRVLNVTLTSNNQQIKPETGTEAIFRCLKPDGNSCVNPAVINADGTVTVEFTKQELAVKGVTLADISLIKNETILSTVSFRILVDEAPVSVSKVKSSGEFLILLDTIKAAETAIEKAAIAANEAKSATEAAIMARQYSDSSTAATNEAADLAHAAKTEAEEAAQNANVAVDNANSAAQAAKDLVEEVNTKLTNGEFDGADYILTSSDKIEIAKLVEPLAESMQGGTVTYEIPKEYYSANVFAFDRYHTTDPNKPGINIFIPTTTIELAEIKIDAVRFEADANAGLFECEEPENFSDWSIDEKANWYDKLYEPYMTVSQNSWCPNPIKSWIYYAVESSSGMTLQSVFRNDISIRISIKKNAADEITAIISNPNMVSSNDAINVFYPVITKISLSDEESGIDTLKFAILLFGNCPKYSDNGGYVTLDDTIEEATITYIPNNTFVEADKNESI